MKLSNTKDYKSDIIKNQVKINYLKQRFLYKLHKKTLMHSLYKFKEQHLQL